MNGTAGYQAGSSCEKRASKMIGLVLPAYSHDPERLFQSVRESSEAVRWYIFLHKENPQLEMKLVSFAANNDVQLFLYRENRGLARSWNEGIKKSINDGCETTIILNDDLHFVPGGFQKFVDHLRVTSGWSLGYINGLEHGGHFAGQVICEGMACFAISQTCIDAIGYFDETFTPAYYEDIDYQRRMQLARCEQTIAPGVLGEHLRQTTLGSNPELKASMADWHRRNELYFERKWGPIGHEVHTTPFGDPGLGLKIEWDARTDPYPDR